VLCPGATSTIFRCAQRLLLTALLRNRPSRSCTWQPVPLRYFYACPTLHSCNSLQSRFFECKLQLLIPSGSQTGTSASGKYSRCENQRVDQGEPLSSRRRLRRAILPPQAEGHSAGWTSKGQCSPGLSRGQVPVYAQTRNGSTVYRSGQDSCPCIYVNHPKMLNQPFLD